MQASDTIYIYFIILIIVSFLAAIAGAVLKEAAHHQSIYLFGVAVFIYSLSSAGIYKIYLLQPNVTFVSMTLITLTLTITTTMVISWAFLNEPQSWKALGILLTASVLLALTNKTSIGG